MVGKDFSLEYIQQQDWIPQGSYNAGGGWNSSKIWKSDLVLNFERLNSARN